MANDICATVTTASGLPAEDLAASTSNDSHLASMMQLVAQMWLAERDLRVSFMTFTLMMKGSSPNYQQSKCKAAKPSNLENNNSDSKFQI